MIRISIYSAFSGFFKQTKVTRPPAKWPKHKSQETQNGYSNNKDMKTADS